MLFELFETTTNSGRNFDLMQITDKAARGRLCKIIPCTFEDGKEEIEGSVAST